MAYQQVLSPLSETPGPSVVAGVHWASGTLNLPNGSSDLIMPQQIYFSLDDSNRKQSF